MPPLAKSARICQSQVKRREKGHEEQQAAFGADWGPVRAIRLESGQGAGEEIGCPGDEVVDVEMGDAEMDCPDDRVGDEATLLVDHRAFSDGFHWLER